MTPLEQCATAARARTKTYTGPHRGLVPVLAAAGGLRPERDEGLAHRALSRDMGYVDGRNLNFDWRNQADAAAAARTMKQWVAAPVDLIVGFEDRA